MFDGSVYKRDIDNVRASLTDDTITLLKTKNVIKTNDDVQYYVADDYADEFLYLSAVPFPLSSHLDTGVRTGAKL